MIYLMQKVIQAGICTLSACIVLCLPVFLIKRVWGAFCCMLLCIAACFPCVQWSKLYSMFTRQARMGVNSFGPE